MIKEITPQIAALYLGQKWGQVGSMVEFYAETVSIWDIGDCDRIRFKICQVVPHLRRLSSMTEAEAIEAYKLRYNREVIDYWPSAIQWWQDVSGDELYVSETQIGNPAVWLYLLGKGFDLFGLIDAGLAKEVSGTDIAG